MWIRLGWVFCSLLHLLLRFQNLPGVLTDHGLVFNDTDPYYRLHRVERMTKEGLAYPLKDPDLSFPTGFDVPWPLGLDLIVAAPARVFGIHDTATLETLSATVIPLLDFPTLVLTGAAVTSLAGPVVGLAGGFLQATSPAAVNAGGVGRFDHHVLEGFFTALALYLLSRLRKKPTRRIWTAGVLMLSFAPSLWPQAWVLSLFLSLAMAMDREMVLRRTAPLFFLISSLLSLGPLALSDRFTAGTFSLYGFSWWTPLLYAVLAAAFLFINAVMDRRLPGRALAVATLSCLAGMLIFLWLRNKGAMFATVSTQTVQAVTASQGTLATTSETISPLRFPILRWPFLGLISLAIAWLWLTLQAFRRSSWWLVGYVLGPMILALSQARFIPMATPILCITTLLFLSDLFDRVTVKPCMKNIFVSGTVLSMMIPTVPTLKWTKSENTHPFFSAVRGATLFLEAETERRHLAREDRAVAAHWDYGHWLLYYANAPVVAHPFQDAASTELLRLYVSDRPEELDQFIQRHPVRYLLIEAPTGRLARWLTIAGKSPDSYFVPKKGANGILTLDAKPEFHQLLAPRFFLRGGEDASGHFPDNWRLVFVSKFASPDRQDLPAIKLFERVKGANVTLTGVKEAMTLSAHVEAADGPIEFSSTAQPIEGKLSWHVPYGTYRRAGVVFDGTYALLNHKGKKVSTFTVTEDDILEGRRIDLP